ncbi:beta-ketoacyl synthase N-terminal-like domain-containing protein [Streptomyces sp. NPDC050433]|uniref:beta-ketoacyl synthase N-terminal-like domain-containing protein n=1 Tax=Streptomyces sp. NPDC050433 TaxID=3365615 RepID=UPI0037BAF2F1
MTAPAAFAGVAVTGMHLACALGDTPAAVWTGISGAVPGLTRRAERHTCGLLARDDSADTVRLAVRHAVAAWEQAGLAPLPEAGRCAERGVPERVVPERVALVLGTTDWGAPDFRHHLPTHRDQALARPHTAADAIAAALGLTGPREVFVNGCVASACALARAAELIRAGRIDAALVGGVNVLDDSVLAAFDSWRALDRGPCSPYDRSAGTSLGEGVAFLVLEDGAAAARRGAKPVGYLTGHALTGDAHHITAPHPRGEGLRRAVSAALADAGLTPDEVGYINGHGTGTRANDTAELAALAAVFPSGTPLSSTKSQTGHTLGASGALEAAVTLLALRRGIVPPTLDGALGPAADQPAGADTVTAEELSGHTARGGTQDTTEFRHAVSVSVGFGGQNAALVFAASRPPARPPKPAAREVMVTGAGVITPNAYGRSAFLAHLRTAGPAPLDSALEAVLELDEDELAPHIPTGLWTRLDPFGRIVLAAAGLARTDAFGEEPPFGERVGVVIATASGPVTTHTAMAELHAQGQTPSPLLAPNSVAAVHAGHAAMALGARGPATVVSAGDASGLLALGQAADLIRHDHADTVYVIAADEAAPALRAAFAHHGLLTKEAGRPYDLAADGGVLTPAGVALVLESAGQSARRGFRTLGTVLTCANAGAPVEPGGVEASGETLARCLTEAAARSGFGPGTPLHLYGTSWGNPALDEAEASALATVPGAVLPTNITGITGHTQAAGGLLATLAALEACTDPVVGRRPLTATRRPLPEITRALTHPGPARAALVTATSWGGTCAAAAVRAPA